MFYWCSNIMMSTDIKFLVKYPFILLTILFILIIERIPRLCIFTNVNCFIRKKFLIQTWSHIDRGSIGFIEYIIIPCRQLNSQVTLAVYFFFTHLIVFQWKMSRRLEGKQPLRLGSPSLRVFSSYFLLSTL